MAFTPRGRLLALITATLIRAYRLTDGRVGGRLRGMPGILVTTTGRKTGQPRTVHLPYLPDGGDMILVASFAGGPHNPAWYHNLVADPDVTVQDHREIFPARAAPVPDEQRAQLWARLVARAPWYTGYQARTDRLIPLVRVTRA